MNSRDTYPILDLSSSTEDTVDPVEVNNFDEDDENQGVSFYISGRECMMSLFDFIRIPNILKKTGTHLIMVIVILFFVIILIKQVNSKQQYSSILPIRYIFFAKNQQAVEDSEQHSSEPQTSQNSSECVSGWNFLNKTEKCYKYFPL